MADGKRLLQGAYGSYDPEDEVGKLFARVPVDYDLKMVRLGLTQTEERVLRVLLGFWSPDRGHEVWAASRVIERRTGVAASNVRTALRKLVRGTKKHPPLLRIASGYTDTRGPTYDLRPLWAAMDAIDVRHLFLSARAVESGQIDGHVDEAPLVAPPAPPAVNPVPVALPILAPPPAFPFRPMTDGERDALITRRLEALKRREAQPVPRPQVPLVLSAA